MARFKKATLTDVAQRAGVSVTTASYILNGRSTQMRISAETARRVEAAMHDLDYRPNWSARTLRRRSSTQTIGLISDFVASGAFSSRLLTGASSAARSWDHLLVIGESMGDPDAESLLVRDLLDRQVDGIVYATLTASTVRLPASLRGVRAVLLNCQDPDVDVPAVLPDDEAGGRLAVECLVASGVRAPFHVVGEDPTPESTAGTDRLRGIEAALAEAGAGLAGVVQCAWDVAPAYAAVAGWLRAGARPGALICLNDRIAMGVYQALAELDIAVPEDVSVISFDGSDLSGWLRPRLTSLALPFHEMGARAVELLMERGRQAPRVTRLPLALQVGDSVRGLVPASRERQDR
ncbi:MAG: LacI family DNA-binding transcriptional regulator [Marmoricola sp.]